MTDDRTPEEEAVSRLLKGAVDGIEPSEGTLEDLRTRVAHRQLWQGAIVTGVTVGAFVGAGIAGVLPGQGQPSNHRSSVPSNSASPFPTTHADITQSNMALHVTLAPDGKASIAETMDGSRKVISGNGPEQLTQAMADAAAYVRANGTLATLEASGNLGTGDRKGLSTAQIDDFNQGHDVLPPGGLKLPVFGALLNLEKGLGGIPAKKVDIVGGDLPPGSINSNTPDFGGMQEFADRVGATVNIASTLIVTPNGIGDKKADGTPYIDPTAPTTNLITPSSTPNSTPSARRR